MGAEHRRGVEHSRNTHVVDERLRAQCLLQPQIARRRLPDAIAAVPILGGTSQAEIFAEVRMAARFFAREPLLPIPDFAGGLDGVDDARVACTAAQVAIQRFRDLFPALRAIALQQPRGADHNPGNAEAALDRAFQQKSFAQHTTHVVGYAFERDHFAPFHVLRLPQARQYGLAVHQNGAAAASAFRRAAVFGRNDFALLAQHFEKVHARLVRHRGRLAVQRKCGLRHLLAVHPPALQAIRIVRKINGRAPRHRLPGLGGQAWAGYTWAGNLGGQALTPSRWR